MQNSIKNDYLNCTLPVLFRTEVIYDVEMMDEGVMESILIHKVA